MQRVQVLEHGPLHQLGVQRGDAVHAARADEGQVSHAYLAAFDHPDAVGPPHRGGVMRVDALHQLHVPGQDAAHEVHRPAFQRFGQQGVVGVVETGAGDLEGVVERLSVVVDQEADQFREGDGRVGVVELDGDGPGQPRDVAMVCEEPAQDVGERGGGEEVLLLEPELPALLGGVVGVEYAADGLGQDRGGGGRHPVAPVEGLQVEFPNRPGGPEAQRVGPAPAPAGNRRVVGDGQHGFRRRPRSTGTVGAH